MVDGFESYAIIVDEMTRHVWVFLAKPKDPPADTASSFPKRYGHDDGGMILCDQGRELTRSEKFLTKMMEDHDYIVEQTGVDALAQYGGAESWNGTFAVTVRIMI